jgi:uncharacterized protein (TIGR00106 family)
MIVNEGLCLASLFPRPWGYERSIFIKLPQNEEWWNMLVQFKVVPIGKGESLSPYVAECIKIVQASGIKYQLTPMATILEGDWGDVMDTIHKCHTKVRSMSHRVVTTIEVDDREGRTDAMEHKVRSVQEKLVPR